jgi:hypothetical protein
MQNTPALKTEHVRKPASHFIAEEAVAKQSPVATVPAPAPAPVQVQPVQQPVPGSHEDWMSQAGISQSDWPAVDYIISHESGWCPTKWEGEIGIGCPEYHGYSKVGYGLCQSTPAIKMAVAGDDWATNPVTQLKWCNSYAQTCEVYRHYCGWWGAYNHWVANRNW